MGFVPLSLLIFFAMVAILVAVAKTCPASLRFPKPWHGVFMVFLGGATGFLGAMGLFGGLKHEEHDVDCIVWFLAAGLTISLIGVGVLVWGAVRVWQTRKQKRPKQ